MSVINNQRDMDNFLFDLRGSDKSGEFTAKDREQIAEALPTEVLMKALLERKQIAQALPTEMLESALEARVPKESFRPNPVPPLFEQKSDVLIRILNLWVHAPELRFGQLVINAFENNSPYSTSGEFARVVFNCEDGDLVRQIEAFVKRYTQPPR